MTTRAGDVWLWNDRDEYLIRKIIAGACVLECVASPDPAKVGFVNETYSPLPKQGTFWRFLRHGKSKDFLDLYDRLSEGVAREPNA